MSLNKIIYLLVLFFLGGAVSALASGSNFNDTTQKAVVASTSGNVGIGSTSPGQMLDVAGTVRAISFVNQAGTAISGSQWATQNTTDVSLAGGNVGIGTTLTTHAALSVMNGNVGIGTVTPNAQLFVNGAVSVLNLNGGDSFQSNSGIRVYDTSFSGYGTWLSASTADGYTPNADGTWHSWGPYWINYYSSGYLNLGNGGGGVSVGVDSQQGGFAPTGDTFFVNGTSYFNNNVGIGSATPRQLLDVAGTVRMTGFTLNSGSSLNTKVLTSDANGNGTWQTPSVSSNYWSLAGGAGNVGISTTNTVGIGTTQGTSKLTILGNVAIAKTANDSYLTTAAPSGGMIVEGCIGIGTTAPAYVLDVRGQFQVNSGSNGDSFKLTSSDSAGTHFDLLSTYSSGSSWQIGSNSSDYPGDMYFYSNGFGASPVIFDGSGNVFLNVQGGGKTGINTNSPAYQLDVNGDIGNSSNGAAQYITLDDGDSNIIIHADGTARLQAAIVDINGGLSINSGSTYQTLNVNGSNIFQLVNTNGGSGAYSEYQLHNDQGLAGFGLVSSTNTSYGSGNQAYFFNDLGGMNLRTNGDFRFLTGGYPGAEKMRLVASGNVGIGSASPGQMLDVAGTVRATQFIAGTGGITLGGSNKTAWPSSVTVSGSNMLFGDGGGGITNVSSTAASGGNIGIGTTTLTSNLLTIGSTGQDVIATNGNVGIGTSAPTSTLAVSGSMAVATVGKSGTYSAGASDNVILVTTGSGGVTITLPTASSVPGRVYQIKKIDSGAGALTINVSGGGNIDGASSITTTTQYQSFTVVSDGTQWWVI